MRCAKLFVAVFGAGFHRLRRADRAGGVRANGLDHVNVTFAESSTAARFELTAVGSECPAAGDKAARRVRAWAEQVLHTELGFA